jgi:CheY-like chemotaxis protein
LEHVKTDGRNALNLNLANEACPCRDFVRHDGIYFAGIECCTAKSIRVVGSNDKPRRQSANRGGGFMTGPDSDCEPTSEDSPEEFRTSVDLTCDVSQILLDRTKEVARLIENRVWQAIGCAPPGSDEIEGGAAECRSVGEPTNRLHLLLIEDECDALVSLSQMLRCWGLDVSIAASPNQAIADTLQRLPNIIVSDINLGGADGCVLAEQLLAVIGLLGKPRPLLIAISGLGDEVEERCRAVGFDHFFRKPADPAALWRLLAEFSACHAVGNPRRQ